MAWTIDYSPVAESQLRRLDRQVARRISAYMMQVGQLNDPRQKGSPLSGPLAGRWRYRVGDYRAICEIRDADLVVLVVEVGHRREIYR